VSYLAPDAKPLTLGHFAGMRAAGEKIAALTCYDAAFAAVLDRAGVEIILVGDSLGNVVQGHSSTLPVTLADVAYHTGCVARGARRALVMADLPFGAYQASREQAFHAAVTLMQAGAQAVKLEGGLFMAETVRFLVERGVPVCAHIGLTPQAVHQLGGYRVQGRDEAGAARLKAEALAFEAAGAAFVVLEMVPTTLAAAITASLSHMATIGIGAGRGCDGQILVLHDAIGVFPNKKVRFAKDFVAGAGGVEAGLCAYAAAVKDRSFPGDEHGFA